jgi:superfamily II DNA or RNA helicase
MRPNDLKPNIIIEGPFFSEPVQIIALTPMGKSVRISGRGMKTNQFYQPILNPEQLAKLTATPEAEPFDGDSKLFKLGIEAMRLQLAYEYDPYFSLSIARIDPLPHQLEAVYDYFLQQPRIRFMLADDPGAGKTIMAGLLLKELKIRGLVRRVLIITPANLTFQWQREMKDKFRENFEVIRGDVLRANYGSNPWQERHQVITSISWVSRIDDARDSLLRSHWDLIIVDEAHKMSAYSSDKKTLAYQLGESLADLTDHYLLMTATPHKGDPKHFCLFLSLLDRDVYGDVASLEEAVRRNNAPFYLRRTKEALVTFPDPETGQVKKIYTNRNVDTIDFQITPEEMDFYESLTNYVEEQSIKAATDLSARGRALSFTMAMLQRRFASSTRAVRRSLERMRDRRQKILDDPESYRQQQIERQLPDDFDDLTESEQDAIIADLESVVASPNPADLRQEIAQLNRLIDLALDLEMREIESKLVKLRETLQQQGIFNDEKMRLLIFTEHKDTLDYLVEKLREWGLSVTQIHGGMKIGDRNTPGTRIFAEWEFKDKCRVMVATEAAGEGINLQFCWFMVNYDIPWNPMRLEQRMGRIHRYGQEKDCLILNFVSINTREGRVFQKLFERIRAIERDLDPENTGKVFNVLGDVFPSNQLEKMLRDMYARNLTEDVIKSRIVAEVDTERFRRITDSALEGLAKRELNLSVLIGKEAEARERRLVPEVIEDFFLTASPLAGVQQSAGKKQSHIYRIGRVPRTLWTIGERLEPRFGKLGHEYKHIVFDKALLTDDPTLEWVTPGHPLFEVIREYTLELAIESLQRGAVFYDLHRNDAGVLDIFEASIQDGLGNVLHQRLYVVQSDVEGTLTVRQPTLFLDIQPAPENTVVPPVDGLPTLPVIENFLIEQELQRLLDEIGSERRRQTEIVHRHMQISLETIIMRVQMQYNDLTMQPTSDIGIEGRIKMLEDRLYELNNRLDKRTLEIERERECSIGNLRHVGRAWVLPHPERDKPSVAPMVRDDEIERIAVEAVKAFEEARGWEVESVENEDRGFDLISRRYNPEDRHTVAEVRFIEVKGRAGIGEVILSSNEYKTAVRLKRDYWLYVVYNCAALPDLRTINDPAQLGWKPMRIIEHYKIGAEDILKASQ